MVRHAASRAPAPPAPPPPPPAAPCACLPPPLAGTAGQPSPLPLPPCAAAAPLKGLPGCAGADWERYQATAGSPECREWDRRSTLDPCPPACRDAFLAVRKADGMSGAKLCMRLPG